MMPTDQALLLMHGQALILSIDRQEIGVVTGIFIDPDRQQARWITVEIDNEWDTVLPAWTASIDGLECTIAHEARVIRHAPVRIRPLQGTISEAQEMVLQHYFHIRIPSATPAHNLIRRALRSQMT